jgi:DNA-binding IclR family transcriptional regulator
VFRPDDSRQALEVGSLVPAHATALGKALLASRRYLAAELLGGDGLTSYTPSTVTDIYRLRRELDEISEHGWASDVGELYRDTASIAAPVTDRRRVAVGAIGISGPIARLCDGSARPRADLIGFVTTSARSVSRELGALPW